MRPPLLTLLIPLMLSGCTGNCANTVVDQVVAPGDQFAAVLFQRDCGATTGFSTQISIVHPEEKPDGGGNVFIADSNHGAASVGSWGGPWAEMKWLAHDHLLVRHDANSRVFKQNGQVSGVQISYQAVAR